MTAPSWSELIIHFTQFSAQHYFYLLLIASAIILILLVAGKISYRPILWTFLALAVLPWLMSFAVSQYVPILQAKYLHFTLMPFLMMCSILVWYFVKDRGLMLIGTALIGPGARPDGRRTAGARARTTAPVGCAIP
jgi:hypothetical protein